MGEGELAEGDKAGNVTYLKFMYFLANEMATAKAKLKPSHFVYTIKSRAFALSPSLSLSLISHEIYRNRIVSLLLSIPTLLPKNDTHTHTRVRLHVVSHFMFLILAGRLIRNHFFLSLFFVVALSKNVPRPGPHGVCAICKCDCISHSQIEINELTT